VVPLFEKRERALFHGGRKNRGGRAQRVIRREKRTWVHAIGNQVAKFGVNGFGSYGEGR